MGRFLKFENIDTIPRQVFDALINDDDLFKLVFYDEFEPLTFPTLTLEEKIALINTRAEQVGSRIFFSCYTDNVEDDEHTQIRISISEIIPEKDNLSTVFIRVDIICHNNLVLIKDGNRDRLIMQKIVSNLNGNGDTDSVSQLQLPLNRSIVNFNYNKNFQGYRLHFRGRISDKGVN